MPTGRAERLSGAEEPAWHALDVTATFARVASGLAGLSRAEASERLALHGPNVIQRQPGEGPWRILLRQVESPLIGVLVGATVVAALVGKGADAAVVAAVVVVNTLIGFFQEYSASKSIEALARMVPEVATVLRDGERRSVPAEQLVPGDLVTLGSGDRVPADLRLVAVKGLRVEEAALTGESVPMEKGTSAVGEETPLADRAGLVYAGTLVTAGSGTGLVVATGAGTELGRISGLLRDVTSLDTPLTTALARLGRWITIGVLAVTVAILVVGTARSLGQGVALGTTVRDMLVFAVALAVGAIPEGLPAIVTIALAIGVRRMAARKAIIRKLPAVETLGSTTVICSDKTGTLTRNEMTATSIWTPGVEVEIEGTGYAPEGRLLVNGAPVPAPDPVRELLAAALLCSDATVQGEGGTHTVTGDPTEAALVVAAAKAGLEPERLRAVSPRLDALPFESEIQFMATLVRFEDGSRRLLVKGATEVVLARCATRDGGAPLEPEVVKARMEAFSARGLRVLAIAARPWTDGEDRLEDSAQVSGLRLLGLVGMIDPPRPEAIAAVAACRAAGVDVKMITGDHLGTARAIGASLGLVAADDRALSGPQLAALDATGLRVAAREVRVFARVAPDQKLALVRALQSQGQVVAMTGDGVNDAPALRQADIGIAMGITGTSVSREASDMVLADDNFATIVGAVEEGRRVYDNLVKSLAFLLPTNLALALLFFVAVLLFPFDAATSTLLLPIRPTQLLWVNLIAAVALALPLAFEAKERDLMRRPPRPPGEPILSPFVIRRTALVALLVTAGTVGLFLFEWRRELALGVAGAVALAAAQTKAVTAIISFQVFYMVQCRSLRGTVAQIGYLSNPAVLPGIGAVLLLHALFVYAPFMNGLFGSYPLALTELAGAAAVGATILPVVGIEKWLARRREAPAA